MLKMLILVSSLFAFPLFIGSNLQAAGLSVSEQKTVRSINTFVLQAGKHFAAEDYAAAAKSIEQAIIQVESGAITSPEVYDAMVPTMKRISKARTMLEFEGIVIRPFRIPAKPEQSKSESPALTEPAKKPDPGPMPTKSSKGPFSNMESTMVSFNETVSPILVERCGKCHVAASKGGFNMATFVALMAGPPEGVVVFAGDTVASRLIETIETGDMPRGGGKVTPEELQVLKKWITEGAKFDGTDPSAPLSGGTAPMSETADKVQVQRATGNETVSFSKDVAPLLVDNCNGCHIDAMQVRGGLRMDDFARLLRGGDSGAVIVPGKGEASLLVQKLRGTSGDRMPAGGRPALSGEAIQLISTWIDEGARLDGASETQSLRVMSQLAWAKSATAGQLSERRKSLAEKNVRLVNASVDEFETTTTDHFFLIGSTSAATLDLVAQLAETQMKTVQTVVRGDPKESFFRGRATIFVMPRRYDYSEFAKMVEARSVPSDWSSHWQFDGIDAYVALVASDSEEKETIDAKLTSPLVALAVATRGDVPRWLAEGVGTATAARKRGSDKDQRRKIESEVSQALSAVKDAKQFLQGKMTPEQSDRIGAAIATTMMDRTNRRSFDALLRSLQAGKSFDQAFAEAFRVSPIAFVDSWIKWARGG